MATKSAMLLHI